MVAGAMSPCPVQQGQAVCWVLLLVHLVFPLDHFLHFVVATTHGHFYPNRDVLDY
jgi:hypothetical protein